MPKKRKKNDRLRDERIEIQGHRIERRILAGREELWIDGIRHRVLASNNGYNLYDDAYSPPKPSLMEAAQAYVEKLAVSGRK